MWCTLLGVTFLPMLAFFVRPDARTLDRALMLTIGMTAAAAIIAIHTNLQAVLSGNLASIEDGRITTDTLDPISFGHVGASLAIVSTAVLLKRRTVGTIVRLFCITMLTLGITVLVLSGSRGPLLALIVGFAVLFLATCRRGGRLRVLVVSVTILSGVFFLGRALQERVGFGVFSRIQGISADFDMQSEGLDTVVLLPRLGMNQIGHVLDAADALLVHLRDSPLFAITLPSKTQAYLLAGRSIVMGVSADAARLIEQAKAGVCARPEDPEAISDAVLGLASLPASELVAMGARARRYYHESLSLAIGTQRMIGVFEDAVSHCRHAPRSERA